MSSMLSAPATMPATRAVTFPPAWAPLSAGTLRCRSANTASPVAALFAADEDERRGLPSAVRAEEPVTQPDWDVNVTLNDARTVPLLAPRSARGEVQPHSRS